VRRLAKRLEPATIRELLVVITADQFGRPPKPPWFPNGAGRCRQGRRVRVFLLEADLPA